MKKFYSLTQIKQREIKTSELVVAEDREENEPCQRNTPGCCVDHSKTDHGCECW